MGAGHEVQHGANADLRPVGAPRFLDPLLCGGDSLLLCFEDGPPLLC